VTNTPARQASRRSWARLLLAFPILIYAWGMAPSLVGGDPDEFLLQAYRRGVGHPGGSPVYIWIGSLFMLLTDNALYTMNLVSVVFSALTLVLLFLLVRRIGVAVAPATVAVLMFAFTPVIWRFAMTAERYNVNAFFLVVVLTLYYLWSERHEMKYLLAAGVLAGVSLGVYFPNVLMLVPILLYVAMESRSERRRLGRVLWTCLAILLGAAGPFVYVYFRSRALPPIGTEYNPDTLANLFVYLTAEGRSTMIPILTVLATRLVVHLGLFAVSFLGVGLLLAFDGGRAGWRRHRNYTVFLLLLLGFNFGFFTYYMSDARLNKPTLSYVVVAILLAMGLEELYARKRDATTTLTVAFAGLIALQVVGFASLQRLGLTAGAVPAPFRIFKRDTAQLDEARTVLSSLPKSSVLFSSWHLFPSLLCVQSILKEREEIDVYEGSLRPRRYGRDGSIVTIDALRYIEEHVRESDRPIFYLRPHPSVRAHVEARYALDETRPGLFRIRPAEPAR